jgi:hypothetical protein
MISTRNMKVSILLIFLMAGFLSVGCRTEKEDSYRLSGTVFFEDGTRLDFKEMTGLIFSLKEGAESVPQNVSEWPVFFDEMSVSRAIPLSWVKSIEVLSFETKGLYRCLFNPVVSVESVTGVKIRSEYETLEWIKVKVEGETQGQIREKHIYFADIGTYLVSFKEADINIRKIVFNN